MNIEIIHTKAYTDIKLTCSFHRIDAAVDETSPDTCTLCNSLAIGLKFQHFHSVI
jgi:hypothetical protein